MVALFAVSADVLEELATAALSTRNVRVHT